MTCDMCGTAFKSGKDILIHGCYVCNKGFNHNSDDTANLIVAQSKYCSSNLRRNLYIKHKIPLELLETALRGMKCIKYYFVR